MSLRVWLLLALGVIACGGSHVARDGGPDGAGPTDDSGPLDAGVVVAQGDCPEGHACGCVGVFARCEDGCECPAGQHCDEGSGLCLLDVEGRLDRCLPGEEAQYVFCASGRVCAVREGQASGLCVSIDACLDLQELGGEVQCRYFDGSAVVSGPPSRDDCPSSEPRFPFCGGPCGEDALCPANDFLGVLANDQCIGLSEGRAFGMCVLPTSSFRCYRDDPDATESIMFSCSGFYGGLEPCACLVLLPDEREAPAVPTSACRAYAFEHPGQARCVNAAWEPV